MNKSFITNLLAAGLTLLGFYLSQPLIFNMGLFAFSGAITNWLAIHMLFEKVPGLYGSGVIPARFEEFKAAIRNLMMQEFFNQQHLDQFIQDTASQEITGTLTPIINQIDLSPSFDKLVEVIMQSSFGSMLGMFGGVEALTPLKEPFIESMKQSLTEMTESDDFHQMIEQELAKTNNSEKLQQQISEVIDSRLEQLTPQMVKQMVQQMIKQHLGWLVVWGGVFGAMIGALTQLVNL
ncbi:MAG: DUF445 family protein [Enterobacterales bacterium]|nr:DUF445 family protein [Enterobacterales bacterium]